MKSLIIQFKDENISKGELCERLWPLTKDRNYDYDTAIPLSFINKVNDKFTNEQLKEFGNISGHFVWFYDNEKRIDYPMPLTNTGCKILGMLALSI